MILLPVVLIAKPAIANPSTSSLVGMAAQTAAEKPIATDESVQKIALNQPAATDESLTRRATSHFRLLGYGLFLLHIGLIPLKLSKGHLMQVEDVRSPR
ncbi:hypothetical protein IQ266_03105 [filamentous cyanobacterium LEGE 11480]|uniref:Uncharacterized protein n=2 Tax=Romeriopsis TaxID=2992131 RepID=A0A928VHK1_9CYAN|nr:hypothetical protein [Romeriopsis navalis LEGE 11480]